MPLAAFALMAANAAGPLCPSARAQQSNASGSTSWTDSVTAPFKWGFHKLGSALNPNPSHVAPGRDDDAVSLATKSKPGPDLYVAIARLYEESGKTAEAEQQYQMALGEKSNHLPALLGYAHLLDSQGKPSEAIELYQRAVKAYPRQASVHNNLGMCYARHNRLDDALAAISRAIQLEPKNPLYRNNIATLLVDQGRMSDAFTQLRDVHGDAAAYYNLGYLLNKKGETQAALQQFAMALRTDPSMEAARRWVEHLQRATAQARLPEHPAGTALRIANQPPLPVGNMPVPPRDLTPSRDLAPPRDLPPPRGPAPQRLPPTGSPKPASDGSALPGMSYESSAATVAPLPPPSGNPGFAPLP
jgi:tetratricopeptide (TPR) repeat protein